MRSSLHFLRLPGLVLSSAALLLACSGKIVVGVLPTTGDATGPEVFTPAQVQAARAQCDEPHGPVLTPVTFGDMRTAITGSWLLCSAQGDGTGDDPAPTIDSSREYDESGQWFNLGLDAQGGLVRLSGVDSQGTWEIEDRDDTVDAGDSAPISGSGSLIIHPDSGGGNGGSTSFESAPTRMQWEPDYFTAWYVQLSQ